MKASKQLSVSRFLIAEKLKTRLLDATQTEVGDCLWVFGWLPIEVSAEVGAGPPPIPVRIRISENWITDAPRIWIADRPAWLRCNPDWHLFTWGEACFEFRPRWRTHFTEIIEAGERDVFDYAAQWITRATAYLLQVHFVCHKFGVNTWPEDVIPSWKHRPAEAQEQYEEERRRLKNKRRDRARR